MKQIRLGFILLLSLSFLSGCDGNGGVKNPPTFVDMYLDDEEAVVPSEAALADPRRDQRIEYDESIYSEKDFNVVVTTNGVNYDLLYSVELNDSLLGPCVYTDQSELYHATSTIKIEADQSYTTEVSLTIPGSYEHDTYLSDRTIFLTKILFSRDTVNGTFPADIPENTTKVLNFEVHAVNYFDAELGYDVAMTDGLINVVIKPGTTEYTTAQTAAKTAFVIPNTINGYGIGRIYLQDLSWITSLTIGGASEDVFILGEFPLLTTMAISGLNFVPPLIDPVYKHLTINGEFSLLTSIAAENCSGYHFFLSKNTVVENENYTTFRNEHSTTLYSFPELALLTIDSSALNIFQVGSDSLGYPFPKLATLTVTDSTISNFYFGSETNDFTKLASISANNSRFGDIKIRGSKIETESPALLNLTSGWYDYIEIRGSIIGGLDLSDSTIKLLDLYGGTVHPSVFASLILDGVVFEPFSPSIRIQGDHPDLTTIDLNNLTPTGINIGLDTNTFASLETIDLSNITASYIYVGQRETAFPSLTEFNIDHVTLSNDFRIGDEGSTFPLLEELLITNSSFANIKIGRIGDHFATLELIYFNNITLTGELNIAMIDSPILETIVLIDVTANSLSIMPILQTGDTFAAYIDNLNLSANPYFYTSCGHIYLVEEDVTTWEYYFAVQALGITMSTGAYNLV